MRGLVLVGAMGLLLAVSAEAQQRPGSRGNDGRGGPGMSARVHPRSAGWYASGFGPFGSYWRLDGAGRPNGMGSRSYGGYSQSNAYGDWSLDSEDGDWVMPQYYSLSGVRFQKSWRGYYILPPNFADQKDAEPETDRR